MSVIISWVKAYTSANDGEVLTGQNLEDIQTSINNHSHTFTTGSFLALSDVPNTYVGQTLKSLRVNAGENALEFYTPSGGGGSTASYTQTFVNGDLGTGTITITHSLGIKAVLCFVFDNNYNLIIPDRTIPNGINTIFIDLISYGAITGTWTVKIVA